MSIKQESVPASPDGAIDLNESVAAGDAVLEDEDTVIRIKHPALRFPPGFANAHARNQAAIALLNSWLEDDSHDAEQQELFRLLSEGIDADRPPGYKLFS